MIANWHESNKTKSMYREGKKNGSKYFPEIQCTKHQINRFIISAWPYRSHHVVTLFKELSIKAEMMELSTCQLVFSWRILYSLNIVSQDMLKAFITMIIL